MSMLVLGGIALSLLAYLGGGSAKVLQLRERLVTALIGLVFIGSAALGRPLIYELARAGMRRKSSAELAGFEALRERAPFRRAMTVAASFRTPSRRVRGKLRWRAAVLAAWGRMDCRTRRGVDLTGAAL